MDPFEKRIRFLMGSEPEDDSLEEKAPPSDAPRIRKNGARYKYNDLGLDKYTDITVPGGDSLQYPPADQIYSNQHYLCKISGITEEKTQTVTIECGFICAGFDTFKLTGNSFVLKTAVGFSYIEDCWRIVKAEKELQAIIVAECARFLTEDLVTGITQSACPLCNRRIAIKNKDYQSKIMVTLSKKIQIVKGYFNG